MKLTITMIVLMWSIPPFIVCRWWCACYVSTWYNCVGLSCTLRLLKYEHRMLWSLLTPALRCSCSPTQRMVFVIQQKSVCSTNERSYYLLCDQCWECPLVKVWSLGLVSKYCNHRLFTVLLHLYFLQYYYHQLHASKHFSGAVTTAHIHSYHLYFTISSPN